MVILDQERRQAARVSVSLDARWKGISGRHAARISNMSLVGCFFETSGNVLPREVIDLEVKMPDGEWLALTGEVVYRAPEGGFGLYFTEMDKEMRITIAQIIERDVTDEP